MTVFTKKYADHTACHIAAANYRWLSDVGVRAPDLLTERSHELDFGFVNGRHAELRDLVPLAAYLGHIHTLAHQAELHRARLDRPYITQNGHQIPDFLGPRLHIIKQRLKLNPQPDSRPNVTQIKRFMWQAVSGPAAFYKDTNPRNILVTADGPALVDFDDLTLAPFGYDLAKLIVTLTMTYCERPPISPALAAYNFAVASITNVSRRDLMKWAEIHHILTSPYVGANGYIRKWDQPSDFRSIWCYR